jgi:hypothetical protein
MLSYEEFQSGWYVEGFAIPTIRGCTKRPKELVGGNRAGRESVKQEREIKEKEAESEEEFSQ